MADNAPLISIKSGELSNVLPSQELIFNVDVNKLRRKYRYILISYFMIINQILNKDFKKIVFLQKYHGIYITSYLVY
jgi:hypothetical protein